MKALLEKIRARVAARIRFIGTQLNALQAVIVAALVANAGQLEGAIAAVVPAQYRGAAGLIAGIVSFVIVHAASNSDAKKVANNAGR